jgi:tetratricopeptide (TPR) repeat protein
MKKLLGKFCLLACLLLLVSTIGKAQTTSNGMLPRGLLIEKVACQNDAAQSYALYLPASYTPEKKWAALYIFDPFARGKVAVEIFHEAAEKYGVIVIGSNNSQNDLSAEKLSEIITSLWKDSHARFSIDEKRVYAAGLSGGARVANYFAISCHGCLAGVIACSATFTPKFPLDKPLPYAIYGTTGVDDFNYPELVTTFKKLKENGTTNHLAIFDGRHGWLPKELTFDALEWLNLQAMESARMPTDKSFVDEILAKQMNQAQTLLQHGETLEAARLYEAMVNDFKDISDTKSAADKLSEIRAQKSYQQALTNEERAFTEQQRAAQRIFSLGADLLDPSSKNGAMQKVSAEIESWQQKAKASADSGERRLARRILDQVFVEAYETALFVNRQQKDYQMMIANLELTRLINPQNPNALWELARAFALGGRKKEAIDMLAQAIEKGFTDCSRMTGKPEWETLRGDKQFQKIIERLNCSDQKP